MEWHLIENCARLPPGLLLPKTFKISKFFELFTCCGLASW
jgi:hypothetical protein